MLSCATVTVKSLDIVGVLDYSPLTSKGIFVTESNSVGFEYNAIGSIYIELRNGAVTKPKDTFKDSDILYSTKADRNKPPVPEAPKSAKNVNYSIDDAVNRLAYELQRLEANGIINLKIQRVEETAFLGRGYVITGMAIRK